MKSYTEAIKDLFERLDTLLYSDDPESVADEIEAAYHSGEIKDETVLLRVCRRCLEILDARARSSFSNYNTDEEDRRKSILVADDFENHALENLSIDTLSFIQSKYWFVLSTPGIEKTIQMAAVLVFGILRDYSGLKRFSQSPGSPAPAEVPAGSPEPVQGERKIPAQIKALIENNMGRGTIVDHGDHVRVVKGLPSVLLELNRYSDLAHLSDELIQEWIRMKNGSRYTLGTIHTTRQMSYPSV